MKIIFEGLFPTIIAPGVEMIFMVSLLRLICGECASYIVAATASATLILAPLLLSNPTAALSTLVDASDRISG